jgi:ArsR family transcriptional regulator, arsenate/arsenite/antimonite-responsive transcriptional repressor
MVSYTSKFIDVLYRDRSTMALTETELPLVECCSPLRGATMTAAEAEATAGVFKALADPHRVRIVNLLANHREAVCVCDITASIGLSQPTTSHHLKKLADAGLLQREQRGVWAYYSLDRNALRRLATVTSVKEARR